MCRHEHPKDNGEDNKLVYLIVVGTACFVIGALLGYFAFLAGGC